MRRWFPPFQVASTCFSCSPPDLNSVVTNCLLSYYVKWPLPPGDNPIAVNKYYLKKVPHMHFYEFCHATRKRYHNYGAWRTPTSLWVSDFEEILNSLFLLHVLQPVLTQTNTTHFAHRTYLCNEYCVMGCDTRGQLTLLATMQKLIWELHPREVTKWQYSSSYAKLDIHVRRKLSNKSAYSGLQARVQSEIALNRP
jgi:hypothetical protein